MLLNFFVFYTFLQHSEEVEVSAEAFIDENSDSDPDVSDSLSYSSKQICKTNQQDSAEMTVFRQCRNDSFQTPFDAENTE